MTLTGNFIMAQRKEGLGVPQIWYFKLKSAVKNYWIIQGRILGMAHVTVCWIWKVGHKRGEDFSVIKKACGIEVLDSRAAHQEECCRFLTSHSK